MTDKQLLDRFIGERDEAAFETIVRRHGATVLRICRSVVNDPHEVDDAFQASFVVLVRNAAAIRDREALGPWLYEVAYRVSSRVRNRLIKRRAETGGRAAVAISMAESNPNSAPDPERRELVSLLQAEVARLPENFRAPIISCYLEGRTHEEAARGLGLPLGTLKGRLRQGRELLRTRLSRRGMAVSLALLLLLLRETQVEAGTQVPEYLVRSTVDAASQALAKKAVTSTIMPRSMLFSTIAMIALGALGSLMLQRPIKSAMKAWAGSEAGDPYAMASRRVNYPCIQLPAFEPAPPTQSQAAPAVAVSGATSASVSVVASRANNGERPTPVNDRARP